MVFCYIMPVTGNTTAHSRDRFTHSNNYYYLNEKVILLPDDTKKGLVPVNINV